MITAMIPARIGSTRLPRKNLAILNGKPLIEYAIEAAINSSCFDRIIVNSDDSIFENNAQKYGVEFYLRPQALGSSQARVDEVVMDFIDQFNPEYLAWVNPVSPLQTAEEVSHAIRYFLEHNFDSFVTVRNLNVHCVYENQPLNFSKEERFEQTQNLKPIQSFVYSICAWRSQVFSQEYHSKGYGFFCGSTGYYPVSLESSFLIKTLDDLKFADLFLRAKNNPDDFQLKYSV